MKPEDLLTLSKEKLIDKLQALNLQEEQRMASMVMIREEILARFKEEKINGEVIGEFSVTKSQRITFKTTIEEAGELGAVIQAPKINTKTLRQLHDSGAKVPGVQKKIYLSVRRLSQSEQEK